MSTFDGNVVEFPDIQIDYFRRNPSRPAVAFFLTHVHSDHIQGLESFKGSFIYCSPATKEILLRLEKFPHRINFARGILETRRQSYTHLKPLLKTIPLETPTVIELRPGRSIRVTLFDANHCIGAVMFLIEGDGKAILYTGDIRSETWWVNALARNPILLPFVCNKGHGPIRRLDNLYLDTTYATKAHQYREFPSKAEGISELLTRVSEYPKGTRFYLDSWTFGYEEVWQALSIFLNVQLHVDDYRYKLYLSLADIPGAHCRPLQAFQLIGSPCGNHYQKGCLTTGYTSLHACEQGTGCEIWDQDFVRITPIVSRHDGRDLLELGTGGGNGDLKRQHVLEIEDTAYMEKFKALCAAHSSKYPSLLGKLITTLNRKFNGSPRRIELDYPSLVKDLPGFESIDPSDTHDVPISSIIPALATQILGTKNTTDPHSLLKNTDALPRKIAFPYSRHSSYSELCLLLKTFQPREIYPCTVDEQNWDWAQSIDNLFGHLYADNRPFEHDKAMQRKKKRRPSNSSDKMVNLSTEKRSCKTPGASGPLRSFPGDFELSHHRVNERGTSKSRQGIVHVPLSSQTGSGFDNERRTPPQLSVSFHEYPTAAARTIDPGANAIQTSYNEAKERIILRQDAYRSALGDESSWFDVTLTSVYGHQKEEEL